MHILAVALLVALPLRVDAWSCQRLDLELRVTPPTVELRGKGVVRLDEGESHGPVFRINNRKHVMKLRQLRSGSVTATIAPFEGPIDAAKLTFERTFQAGDSVDFEFIAQSDEQSMQFLIDDRVAYASWVEYWYPVPAASAEDRSSPAVPGTTSFVLPPGWHSASNGVLTEQNGREVWTSDVPVARSFVAAPFAVRERVGEISLFLLKPRPAMAEQAAVLAKSLAVMERHFGPYPYPTYHIVEVPNAKAYTASSEQGFIVVTPAILTPTGNLPLFAHEAAHGWWGNLVRPDGPGGKMVSEALAQFGALLSIEGVEGRAAAAEFLRYSRKGYSPKQCARGYFEIWREGGDRPLAELESAKWDHHISDSKGMWFYHMLRNRMGDEAFFGALRTIIDRFRGREVTVKDLRAIMIAARPDDAGLPQFLSQWLDGRGAPVLDVDWRSGADGETVEVHIRQTPKLPPFVFDLEVIVDTKGGGAEKKTLQILEREHTFVFPTRGRPVAVHLDPDDRVLIWRPEYGPKP
ncbi:MAG: M1 family metallopeptidase [Thermoanaerobaculia bacterium]